MLFKTIENLKSRVSFVSLSSLKPATSDFNRVEETVLKKYLGAPMFDQLALQYDQDAIAADSTMEQLLHYAQAIEGYLGLYYLASKQNVDFNSAGIKFSTSQDEKPVWEWQLNDLKKQLLADGWVQVDLMLKHLDANKDDFPLWKDNPAVFTINKKNFVADLAAFESHFSLRGSFVTFFEILPLLNYVEQWVMESMLGSAFYAALKSGIANGTISATNKSLVDKYLAPIAVYLSVSRAVDVLPLEVSSSGIFSNEYVAESMQNKEQKKASFEALKSLQDTMNDDARQMIDNLVNHLNDNASATVYPEWFNSDLYQDPSAEEEEDDCPPENNSFFHV